MAKTKTPEVLTKIISLLTPLESDERKRVISAAMTFLGETKIDFGKNGSVGGNGDEDTTNFPSKVKTWMGQNSITKDELDQVFNIEDGKAEVIASEVPGKSIKRKTLNAYILAGINSFLTSGKILLVTSQIGNLQHEPLPNDQFSFRPPRFFVFGFDLISFLCL